MLIYLSLRLADDMSVVVVVVVVVVVAVKER